MKTTLLLLVTLITLSFSFASCGSPETTDSVADGSTLTLCGDCGQIKGGDACCAEGAEACGGCELTKGAPGCCKMEKGVDAPLCGDCGQIKGAEACCAADAEKCSGCEKAKGSPGCCK